MVMSYNFLCIPTLLLREELMCQQAKLEICLIYDTRCSLNCAHIKQYSVTLDIHYAAVLPRQPYYGSQCHAYDLMGIDSNTLCTGKDVYSELAS